MFDTQWILLLALFSPLVEAFPNLYMSWWAPSNSKLQRYIDTWPRRVLVVLTVWLPILIILAKILNPPALIYVLGLLVFSAFFLRLYVFDKSLTQSQKNKALVEPSKIPEFLYSLAFTSIGFVLYSAVPNLVYLVPLGILMIFTGAFMMSRFRRGKHLNLTLDIVGRSIFIIGFLLNLYNLVRAASVSLV